MYLWDPLPSRLGYLHGSGGGKIVRARTHRDCNSTHKTWTILTLKKNSQCREGKVYSKSHTHSKSNLQSTPFRKKKVSFLQWSVTSYNYHTPGHIPNSTSGWPSQNRLHAFLIFCAFCFLFFSFVLIFFFFFWERKIENIKLGRKRGGRIWEYLTDRKEYDQNIVYENFYLIKSKI